MARVEVKGVSKTFGRVQVLKDVSFIVEDGEFVTLLGPSGCGKTTLLRIVAGLEEPDAGEVRIGEARVTHLSPHQRDIAMVFQSYALYPHMSVYENISVGLRLKRIDQKEIKRQVLETSELLGIRELLDRRPKALSGGQRQRVALARAIVRRPKAFLLDEPLSNLDAALRERTRGELKLLFSEIGATVLYVTHDQIEAMTLSNRIVVLKEGKVQQIGTPDEIYRRPVNVFVATFVGSPKMNLIPGKLEGTQIHCGPISIPWEGADRKGLFKGLPSREVLIGVRPEDILISSEPEAGKGVLRARVIISEPIGSHTILTLEVSDVRLKALVPASMPIPEAVSFEINPASLHFFDAISKRRLEIT